MGDWSTSLDRGRDMPVHGRTGALAVPGTAPCVAIVKPKLNHLLVLATLLSAAVPASAGAVVGGTGASQPYPWMTALEIQGSFACGGSLVAPQLVLTAAHCVTNDDGSVRPPRDFRVLVGAARRSQRASGDDRAVIKVERHEAYGAGDVAFRNDVALLTLDAPSSRQPVALAVAADRPAWQPGKPVRALGWGTQSGIDPVGLTATDDLREVNVPVASDSDCASDYGGAFDSGVMVCAGEPTGGRDTCQGDSGGPLLVGAGGGAFRQVGVVSFGNSCGLPGSPGVYARVGEGALRDWITARLPAATQTADPSAPSTPSSPPAAGASAGCLAAALGFSRTGLPGLRLGKVQRGNGSRCVDGGGRVELRTRRKRLALVVTTAPGHRAGSVHVGGAAPKATTSVKDLRRTPSGVFALVRGSKVVALAAGDTASRKDLRAFARRVRLAAG